MYNFNDNIELKLMYEMGLILQEDIESYLKAYPEDFELTELITVNKVEWSEKYQMLTVNYGDFDLYDFSDSPLEFKQRFMSYINSMKIEKMLIGKER